VARTRVVVRTHVSEARPFGKLRAGYGAPGSGPAQRQPTLHGETVKDGPPAFVEAVKDGAFESTDLVNPPPRPVMGWVVVTSWRVEQRPADPDAPVRAIPTEEFHPYAAVPVRGGWLVIRL